MAIFTGSPRRTRSFTSSYLPRRPATAWSEVFLYGFTLETANQGIPVGVVQDSGGALYGVTGAPPWTLGCSSCGVAFQLTPPAVPGGSWNETTLHTFGGSGDANVPNSTPILGPGGVLYGTTLAGGPNRYGTVYQLSPPSAQGGEWTEKILYSFTGAGDGMAPIAVTLGPDGNLYGTTELVYSDGHPSAYGTAFQLVLQPGS